LVPGIFSVCHFGARDIFGVPLSCTPIWCVPPWSQMSFGVRHFGCVAIWWHHFGARHF